MKVWDEGSVHVTDHVAGVGEGSTVAVDTARAVFATVCGLAEDVVQSLGRVNVRVTSTFVGP
jgi:hypothetical protein